MSSEGHEGGPKLLPETQIQRSFRGAQVGDGLKRVRAEEKDVRVKIAV